jgi:hypothetical protein
VNAFLGDRPSVLDRIRRTLVGLKMPSALEVLDKTVLQLERLLAEELTLREDRRAKMALPARPARGRLLPQCDILRRER